MIEQRWAALDRRSAEQHLESSCLKKEKSLLWTMKMP
jgi:hypothetical protein